MTVKLDRAHLSTESRRAIYIGGGTDFFTANDAAVLVIQVGDLDDATDVLETLERSRARKKKDTPAVPPEQPSNDGGAAAHDVRVEIPLNDKGAVAVVHVAPDATPETMAAVKDAAQTALDVQMEKKPALAAVPTLPVCIVESCGGPGLMDVATQHLFCPTHGAQPTSIRREFVSMAKRKRSAK